MSMNRKKIQVPQNVQRAFLNVARGNMDGQGHLKETLCFLTGHETSDALIVTDLMFPVQESTATKVDDKGICGQDSSLWLSQMSPGAQAHGDDFRLIAWVHSHVQGAPCGFSSIDVHTQYAFKAMFQGWDVYGLVIEIRDDNSCINGWFDITDEGLKTISKCTTTQEQHGKCSSRSFFYDHQELVCEMDLPLTVIDGRNTAAIGSNHPKKEPTIWTLHAQHSNEDSFKGHDVCKCCGKYLGSLQSMVAHIARAKNCKAHYGSEYEVMRRKRRSECVKAYNHAHQEDIRAKQNAYNKKNKEKINLKQSKYNRENQEDVCKRQKQYNTENRKDISKRQKQYDQSHRDQVNDKQARYNRENKEEISKRQKQYDQSHRDQVNDKQARYNRENKEEISKRQKQYNQNHRDQVNDKQARYNRENKEEISKRQKQYDQSHRDQVNDKQARYNRENKEEISKRQKQYDQSHRDQVNDKQARYNRENKEEISKRQKQYDQSHREQVNKKQSSYNRENQEEIALKEFKRKAAKRNPMRDFNVQIASGPVFPCSSCHRLMFFNGVVEYSSQKDLDAVLGTHLFSSTSSEMEQLNANGRIYLCINCNLTLKKGKKPVNSICNGLSLDPIPDELKLTELEQQLIAKRLLFLKIHLLPRSRMPSMRDRVINVPLEDEDICQTMESLPRNANQAGLIGVKFKRMKRLKSSHIQAFIRPGAPQKALAKLKELGHPDYQFETFNLDADSDKASEIDSCSSDEDNEQSVKENKRDSRCDNMLLNTNERQELYNSSTCLVHENLESEVILNNTPCSKMVQCGSEMIELAPGEGKIPTNILSDENIDIKAFPSLFPSGRYGCDYERKFKISKQKYFNQRILNIDNRFRECPTYLFAAQHIVEREQLEKNINLMVQRGQIHIQQDGSHTMSTSDHYAAFQNIRGSPKYFQTARNELLARVAQLGPFQLFFTLSCAEMRWPEVITTLLHFRGHNVICTDEDNLHYTVDGQSYEDFMDKYDISKHDLFKDNIVTVTRMFDHRVKKFVQNLLKPSNSAIPVDYFNYRIEFQMRGMAHVHGVIWLQEEQLDQFRNPFSKVYDSDKIPQLIDTLISCHLPNHDPNLRKIVEEVQTHRHTKTCQKYNDTCRFGYPRFPSKRTLVAKMLPSEMDESERQKTLKAHKEVLKKVKDILESEEKLHDLSIDDLVEKAGITLDDYEKALSISERGYNIVLKRAVSECFINNYNPTWLTLWNANMDLQFCYDPYAVITYICDYYGKDDSGMTDLLKEALKKSKSGGKHEILLALKRAYLTHRQIGACEATYRLLPNLHMKDSNVTCTFVSTGFPEHRAAFMEKVTDDDLDDVDNCTQDNTRPQKNYVKIEGKQGYYKKKISVHERYSLRPKSLEKMCLAQFATMYKVSTYQRKKITMTNNSSDITGNSKIFLTETKLPLEIHFNDSSMSSMQLRSRSSVLRLHESKKKKEEHEYYYAELLLFHPWRDEEVDLHRNNEKMCKRLYKKHFHSIYDRRKTMFPYIDCIEEAQARLEEASLESIRPSHIANTLDAEGEHENEQDNSEGLATSDDFMIYHPGDQQTQSDTSTSKDFSQFKVVQVNLPEMMELTRRLIPEQKAVLDKVVAYCKKVLRSQITGFKSPDPFRLIVHGGAGSGKSNIIKIVAKWAEKILRKAGDHPNKPRILLTAPTGTAASIIGGITLHAAFNFSFGDELKPLSDKKLDELRCALSDIKIVIIDEISMIRSDMLYQLHLRLCEIFQCKKLFGGKSIMLVGDLLQLQPVRGAYIFDAPRCQRYRPYHDVNPLWKEFDVFTLKHNHRQGDAGQWAEALNRFRLGLVTDMDLKMLQEKILSHDQAKAKMHACHLFYTNNEVDEHNNKMLNILTTQLHTIKAAVSVPFGCKSKLHSTGRVDQTAFMGTLTIKIGARVMLIHNLNVVDSLTNGAMGTVLDIKLQEGKPYCIIIKFDNEEIGIEQRSEHENIAKLYKNENGTPIFRTEIMYQLPRGKNGTRQHTATGKLFQFPLRLAWAVTAHKVQGQTFKQGSQIVVHWHKNLAPGMAYVMLGRCESPEDVFISGNFMAKSIKCNAKAKDMAEHIEACSLDNTQNVWRTPHSLKIVLVNARSLREHASDVIQCKEIEELDVLCVTETWLRKGETHSLDCLKHALYASHMQNRGRGCAVYSKEKLSGSIIIEQKHMQGIRVKINGLQIVLLYRSQEQPLQDVLEILNTQVDLSLPTLLTGDFNIHTEGKNMLTQTTKKWHFVQKVDEPTHDCGNILDHVYISEKLASVCTVSLIPVVFSDHDMVKIEIVL